MKPDPGQPRIRGYKVGLVRADFELPANEEFELGALVETHLSILDKTCCWYFIVVFVSFMVVLSICFVVCTGERRPCDWHSDR